MSARAPRLAVMALGALLLAGCAGSGATESRLAAEAEATEGNRVPGYEATRVLERFSASPSPIPPTRTPLPLLARLLVADAIDDAGAPGDQIDRLTPGARVYVAVQVSRLVPGQRLTAVWRDANGREAGTVSIDVTTSDPAAWWVLPWDVPSDLAEGDYAVSVYAEDQLLQSIVVRAR